MKAFVLGSVEASYSPLTQAWTVRRGSWLRLAYTEREAIVCARDMHRHGSAPTDMAGRIAFAESIGTGGPK